MPTMHEALQEAQAIYNEYVKAMETLAASYTTVAERKHAIGIRDAFREAAPEYVKVLLHFAREVR